MINTAKDTLQNLSVVATVRYGRLEICVRSPVLALGAILASVACALIVLPSPDLSALLIINRLLTFHFTVALPLCVS